MQDDLLRAFSEELTADLEVLHPNETLAHIHRLFEEAKKEGVFRDEEEAEMLMQIFLQITNRLHSRAQDCEREAERYRWRALAADAKAKGMRSQVSMYRDVVMGFIAAQRKASRLDKKTQERREQVAADAESHQAQAALLQEQLAELQEKMRAESRQEAPPPPTPEPPPSVPEPRETEPPKGTVAPKSSQKFPRRTSRRSKT